MSGTTRKVSGAGDHGVTPGTHSLTGWSIRGFPLADRPVYDTRIYIADDEKWELCGCLNLTREQYELLVRVFLAHEASYGQPR
jgi:hypothetical protein